MTSRCNEVNAVRLQVKFTFTKGSEVRDKHYKQAGEEGQINVTLLLRRCDLGAPLIFIFGKSKRKENVSGYILEF